METSWWQDEPALLGEALSIFAAFQKDEGVADGGDHTNTNSNTSSTTSSPSGSSEQAVRSSPLTSAIADHSSGRRDHSGRPVKINYSRERQKQEMRQLQASVVLLEEELLRLRMKREKRPRLALPQASSTVLTTASRTPPNGALVAREKATRRQFHARKTAEAVNARLREMLRTQASVVDDLVRIIQPAEATRHEAYGTALVPVPDALFTLSEAASDHELERRLRTLSVQWHVPFAQCAKFQHDTAARPLELYFFETAIVRDKLLESVMEIRASTVFPLPRASLEVELWHYFRTLQCTEQDFSLATESIETSRDTLLGTLRATSSKDGVVGVLDARFMKQQFRNARGELLIVSTTCGRPEVQTTRRPVQDTHKLTQLDAVVTEDSWLRVLDADESDTCIQNVRRTHIQFHGADRPDRKQVEAVKNFLAQLAQNEMRWGSEVVERTLLLAAVNQPTPCVT